MQTKHTSLALLVLILAVSNSNCSSHKKLPVPEQCDTDIEKVSQLLKEKSKTYNKADTQRIQNLISAAKIQQQHGRFIDCTEKMNRALTLMNADAVSVQGAKQN